MVEKNLVNQAVPYGMPGHVKVPTGFFMACYKDPGEIGDKLIRIAEHGDYSHTELVFSDGIAASASLRDGNVRFKRIDLSTGKWDFYALPQHAEPAARQWFQEHVGVKYDLLGVATFPFMYLVPHWRGSKKSVFCSEACSRALGMDDRTERVGPSMLASIVSMIADLEGNILSYPA